MYEMETKRNTERSVLETLMGFDRFRPDKPLSPGRKRVLSQRYFHSIAMICWRRKWSNRFSTDTVLNSAQKASVRVRRRDGVVQQVGDELQKLNSNCMNKKICVDSDLCLNLMDVARSGSNCDCVKEVDSESEEDLFEVSVSDALSPVGDESMAEEEQLDSASRLKGGIQGFEDALVELGHHHRQSEGLESLGVFDTRETKLGRFRSERRLLLDRIECALSEIPSQHMNIIKEEVLNSLRDQEKKAKRNSARDVVETNTNWLDLSEYTQILVKEIEESLFSELLQEILT